MDTANKFFNQNKGENSDVSSEVDGIDNLYIQKKSNIKIKVEPIILGETDNTSIKEEKINNKQAEKVLLFNITNNNSPINIIPKMYYLEDIITILQTNKCDESIIDKIDPDIIQPNDMKCLYFFKVKNNTNQQTESFLGKKRVNENITNEKDKKTCKRGRKPSNENTSSGIHTKLDPDNIIKKIKALFFKLCIDYINAFINKYKKNDVKLLYLDYKQYVNRIKKDFDLGLLNMKVEDFASLDISEKYCSKTNKEFNKNIIKDILEKERDNTIIINFLRNMTLNDLIDILLFKNSFNDCIEFDGFLEDLQTIADESDEKYFSKFILFIYNYKRWFLNKKGRNKKN